MLLALESVSRFVSGVSVELQSGEENRKGGGGNGVRKL